MNKLPKYGIERRQQRTGSTVERAETQTELDFSLHPIPHGILVFFGGWGICTLFLSHIVRFLADPTARHLQLSELKITNGQGHSHAWN